MKGDRARDPIAALVFLAYCALMTYLLFFRDRSAVEGLPYWEQVKENYNLSLGKTVQNFWDILVRREYYLEKWGSAVLYNARAEAAVINLVGNVVMFIPFGTFIPLMWRYLQRVWKAILVGFFSILCVETVQLFTLRGKCDVDDFVLNMTGILVGYGLWRIWEICRRKK